ncbi:GlxA family transcriptional regulator [Thalassospira xiamenensis]|uniref:AraC family transcriptional regulator n=1 Tax=Thalassospira xiamenensis TaxID=220697 RepID=A0A154KVF2_9PROT|nr:GlxA family transcriptional regulator [Thalassospira xiamenensis]KZB54853.1 AraC family transcriptional regulator [Thalassospira xiamenensis]RCK51120.1 AraC family transcriptional regulator [Thalassospira xiamenensis]SOC30080.1 Transcriptional regulator GlxA family, contains an amidase domain and an AraC-type DNA-binding HTH domain [Thalassospira xiamenensis]
MYSGSQNAKAGRLANVTGAGKSGHEKPRLSVGFILAKRFTLCAFANFVDVLRLAADEGDRSRPILCNWTVVSDTMDPVPSSSGIIVQPKERLGDPRRFNYIVVVGGLMEETPNLGSAYHKFLHEAAEAGIPLVGICTGAFLLHRAGLLDGYRCCVSWFHHSDFIEQFEGLDPVADQIFVVDRDRLTCSGGVSSAHLAAYLVDKHVGRAQASKSLHIMIIDDALQAEKPQPGIPLDLKTQDPIVQRALLIMQQNIDTPISVQEIARRMGNSKRQIERHFRLSLDTSPQVAFLNIRLDMAHHLMEKSQKSVAQVAVDCGFCDSSHLSRMFRRRYGCTPQELRRPVSDAVSDAVPVLEEA